MCYLYFTKTHLTTYSFMQQSTTLPGDVLLITAFISYVGCFTKHYRQELLHKIWTPFVKTLDVRVFIIHD